MTAYTKRVEKDKLLSGLAAYSASRPQHSEGLAVFIAAYLAHETARPNIHLLPLSRKKAVQAALRMTTGEPRRTICRLWPDGRPNPASCSPRRVRRLDGADRRAGWLRGFVVGPAKRRRLSPMLA
jgi:hypothetical protein